MTKYSAVVVSCSLKQSIFYGNTPKTTQNIKRQAKRHKHSSKIALPLALAFKTKSYLSIQTKHLHLDQAPLTLDIFMLLEQNID